MNLTYETAEKAMLLTIGVRHTSKRSNIGSLSKCMVD